MWAFASALALAYFTGAWRKYGRRMERLYELAERLPQGSALRAKFEAEALKEAERMAARTLDQPPRLVRIARQVVGSFVVLVAVSTVVNVAGERRVSAWMTDTGYALGRSAAEWGSNFPGAPWQVVLGSWVLISLWSYGALILLWFVLVPYWWSNGHASLLWRRARDGVASLRRLDDRALGVIHRVKQRRRGPSAGGD